MKNVRPNRLPLRALLCIALISLCLPFNALASGAEPLSPSEMHAERFSRAAQGPKPLIDVAFWLLPLFEPYDVDKDEACAEKDAVPTPLYGAELPNHLVAKGGAALLRALVKAKPKGAATSLSERCPALSTSRALVMRLAEALQAEVTQASSFWDISRAAVVVAMAFSPPDAEVGWGLERFERFGADHAVAYFWYEVGESCHGCAPPFGIAWMKRDGDVWRVYAGEFPTGTGGSWGHTSPSRGLLRVGQKQWALHIAHGDTSAGWTTEVETLYVADGKRTRELLNILVHSNDSGADNKHRLDAAFSFAIQGCDARCPLTLNVTEEGGEGMDRGEPTVRTSTHVVRWRKGAYQLPDSVRWQ